MLNETPLRSVAWLILAELSELCSVNVEKPTLRLAAICHTPALAVGEMIKSTWQ